MATYYTTYAYAKGRFGLDFLFSLLADQIDEASTTDTAKEADIQAYIEAEIEKIDAFIDAACVKQVDVPVATTNKSFGLLEAIAEALILRKVASHTQQDDIPSKLENEYIAAMRQLGQIMRGELAIAQTGQTGPSTAGDSIAISEPEETPFHTDLSDAW